MSLYRQKSSRSAVVTAAILGLLVAGTITGSILSVRTTTFAQPPRPTPTRDAEGCFARGKALVEHGQYEEAVAQLTEAIRLAPEYAEAYTARGLAHAALGDYQRAISDYDQALVLEPQLATAYLEGIVREFSMAISLNPDRAMNYMGRGIIYFGLGRFEQAITDFTQAIERAPHDASAYFDRPTFYFCRGLAYFMLGEYVQAVLDWARSLF